MEDEIPALDWLHLPEGARTTSLWDSLHDGNLLVLTSDRLERSIRLEFDVPYLRDFHHLPVTLRFVLLLDGVKSARIDKSVMWPGDDPILDGASFEEQRRLVKEYQSKWRNESSSWSAFEAGLTSEKIDVEVSDATLAERNGREFALKMIIKIDDATFHVVNFRMEGFTLLRSDGVDFGVEKFLALGAEYWEAFAKRRGRQST
ncbi:MAG: hypothetical protein V4587_06360 [Acidobacteriota bacterium]